MCATADERLWNHAAKEKERDREGAQRTRCEHWRNVAASRSWRVGGGGGGGGQPYIPSSQEGGDPMQVVTGTLA